MRIGIGHPGDKSQVTGYVLKQPRSKEHDLITGVLPDAEQAIEILLKDGSEKAMHFLHTE